MTNHNHKTRFVVVACLIFLFMHTEARACGANTWWMWLSPCYESCVNWADHLRDECRQDCSPQDPDMGGSEACFASCESDYCSSIIQCEEREEPSFHGRA